MLLKLKILLHNHALKDEKVEKALYIGYFFEICSVTHFMKSPLFGDQNLGHPPSIRALNDIVMGGRHIKKFNSIY